MLVLAIFLTAIGAIGAIVFDGLRDDARASDAGLVLGSKVMLDGQPSERLRARLDKAADLYDAGLFKHIIVSGGVGREGYSEAKVMADYLAGARAIPRTAILLDEQGNTTQATAINSAAIMKQQGFRSVVVVTQFFHLTRSRYALHRAGVPTVYTAHASYFEMRDIYSTIRELFALPAYWLR
jgi:vancomycin permeability regulator SanA